MFLSDPFSQLIKVEIECFVYYLHLANKLNCTHYFMLKIFGNSAKATIIIHEAFTYYVFRELLGIITTKEKVIKTHSKRNFKNSEAE